MPAKPPCPLHGIAGDALDTVAEGRGTRLQHASTAVRVRPVSLRDDERRKR
jgi:hypothetical protein